MVPHYNRRSIMVCIHIVRMKNTKKNFWTHLKKDFTCLAPMHDVTDAAFRQTIIACGRPDVLYTEFVSIDGLTHERSCKKLTNYYLQFSECERPLVAQLWGSDPKKFSEAAHRIESLGFDGVDINMGCPDKKVIEHGGGAAHMRNQDHALRCIEAVRTSVSIPVSVKTRIGYEKIDMKWISLLLQSGIQALAIHLRTKKELSRVPAHWELMRDIDTLSGREQVVLIGNGDIGIGGAHIHTHHCDGYMIGRAALGNPWIFSPQGKPKELSSRLKMLKRHTKYFQKYFSGIKSYAMLKKHVRGYIGSFPGAKHMREELMCTKTASELIEKIDNLLEKEGR